MLRSPTDGLISTLIREETRATRMNRRAIKSSDCKNHRSNFLNPNKNASSLDQPT